MSGRPQVFPTIINKKVELFQIAKTIMPAKTEVEQFVMATKIASRFKLLLAGL